jgi:uncharacterized protein
MAKPFKENLTKERKQALDALQVNSEHRIILSLDGGGMRGILTIQLLKQLEQVAGIPCYQLFDMVAGTSTGAIIAGLIVTGHSALEIEGLYEDLVKKVFHKKTFGNRFFNPPQFAKDVYRDLLRKVIGEIKIEEACRQTDLDLMITSMDMAASEETFFSCFKQPNNSMYGTYKDLLLRAVMEATMSAPTYFHPLERFVDGGTTTYNNPSLAAFMEAVSYSCPDANACKQIYPLSAITMFSFGTGISRPFIKPNQTIHPKGIDLKFWLDWLMTQTGQDASAMQMDAFRSPIIRQAIEVRRFQISLDPTAIGKIPNSDELNEHVYYSKYLHDLGEDVLGNIDMSDTTHFDLMRVIGQSMAKYVMEDGGAFTRDLLDGVGRDLLVTKTGDIYRIQKQLSSAEWLDSFIS